MNVLETLNSALTGRYRIEREIGRGGGGFLMFAAEQVSLQTILFTDWPQLLSSRNRR